MKTYLASVEEMLIQSGYSIIKQEDQWILLDNNELVMENRRKGDLLMEASTHFGI